MNDNISDDDKKLWLDHMKQPEDITPKEGDEDFAALLDRETIDTDANTNIKEKPKTEPLKSVQKTEPSKTKNYINDEPLDRSIARKLSQGKINPTGKIDLHGLNQQKAYDTLCNFIEKNYYKNNKYVLVVTGKGKSIKQPQHWFDPDKGVLKQKLPLWIKTLPLRHFVIDAVPAHPKHGGGGAFYVVLRRNK